MAIFPVILSGGVGSRLWPLSREHLPKQFLKLPNQQYSFFQQTVLRLNSLAQTPLTVVSNNEHRFIVKQQLSELKIHNATLILEPSSRNTAPAIAAASLYLSKHEHEPLLVVVPSDHIIENEEEFNAKIKSATIASLDNKIVTLGIVCNKPETAYGYIKSGSPIDNGCYEVAEFVEKPDTATAEKYFNSGKYYWNSGMFVFKASTYLSELNKFAPRILENVMKAVEESDIQDNCVLLSDHFNNCAEISIDHAVMEYSKDSVVIPLDSYWNDIGSWSALWEAQSQDPAGNVIHGEVVTKNVANSYLHADHRIVTALGLKDMIVIETADAVLVADKNHSQDVKDIFKKFKEDNHSIVSMHRRVSRPWGQFESIVEGPDYKVKHLFVNPGCSLSLQLHHHRSEHWVVVQGTAEVTRDDEFFILFSGQSTYIPAKAKHRLTNPLDTVLEIIEIQIGAILSENDIERFQDLYGRVKQAEVV